MKVTFWGVRGSIPTPGPSTAGVGGNTSCVEVRTNDDRLFIFGAGSGLRNLGQHLIAQMYEKKRLVIEENQDKQQDKERMTRLKKASEAIPGIIFLSHTHHDHLIGLPFFAPAFFPKTKFKIFSKDPSNGKKLKEVIESYFDESYLPFTYDRHYMRGFPRVSSIRPGEVIPFNDIKISSAELDHPGGCLGFRVEENDTVLTYCTDTSHRGDPLNENVLSLAKNTNLLIHDAQYTPEKRAQFPHFGHSSWEEAAQAAKEANADALALFHHDPDSSDDYLREFVAGARTIFPRTFLAREGLTVTLPLKEIPEW